MCFGVLWQSLTSTWFFQLGPIGPLLDYGPPVSIKGKVLNVVIDLPCSKDDDVPTSGTMDVRIVEVNGKPVSWLQSEQIIRLSWYDKPIRCVSKVGMGTIVSFNAILKSIWGYENSYGFNQRKWLFAQRINAKGTIQDDIVVDTDNTVDIDQRQIITNKVMALSKQAHLFHNDLILALTTGDKQLISLEKKQRINSLGLGHFLAISGLHIGLLYGLVYLLIRFVYLTASLALFRTYRFVGTVIPTQNTTPYILQSVISISLIWGYVILIGAIPSAVRAASAITIYLLIRYTRSTFEPFNVLLAVATISVIFEPWSFLNSSWWLSFYAVLGILVFVRFVRLQYTFKLHGLYKYLINLILYITLFQVFIFVWMLPIIFWFFGGVGTFSVITNLLFSPIFATVIMPLVAFGAFFISISEPMAALFYSLADLALVTMFDAFIYLQLYKSWWSGSDSTFQLVIILIISAPLILLCLFKLASPISVYVLLAIKTIATTDLKAKKNVGQIYSINNKSIYIALTCLCLVVAQFLLKDMSVIDQKTNTQSNKKAQLDSSSEITIFDVGQGSAMMITAGNMHRGRLPLRSTILFDLGPLFNNGFSATESVIVPTVQRQGIKTIDQVILTHLDADHIGDANALIKAGYKPKFDDCDNFDDLPAITNWPEITFDILWPSQTQWPYLQEVWPILSRNDRSCVVLITETSTGTKILITGDISHKVERVLVDAYYAGSLDLTADILIVPHHGSRHSSSKPFIYAVAPKVVIYSSGVNNRFGMPSEQVMSRYERYMMRQFNTARSGQLTIKFDSDKSTFVVKETLNKWSPFWKKQNPFSIHGQIR